MGEDDGGGSGHADPAAPEIGGQGELAPGGRASQYGRAGSAATGQTARTPGGIHGDWRSPRKGLPDLTRTDKARMASSRKKAVASWEDESSDDEDRGGGRAGVKKSENNDSYQ